MSSNRPLTRRIARPALLGRDDELTRLDALIAADGGCLLLSGDTGIGKSALLEATATQASAAGSLVLRAVGSEFESDLSYAALNQLLLPLHQGIRELGAIHRDALSVALGLDGGPSAERMVVSTAALLLLGQAAVQRPVIVVVDDVHWLDRSSATVLRFIARRLAGSGVAMLVAVRTGEAGPFDPTGLPGLAIGPLDPRASELLLAVHFSHLAPAERADILTEAQGNPLALLELPRCRGRDSAATTPGRLHTHFAARVDRLPPATRQLLLHAALQGDDGADAWAGSWEALDDLVPAESSGLIHIDRHSGSIRFRHPLVRSAIVEAATGAQRRAAHRALASRMTSQPERRAWHLAAACAGPDEEVAAVLERAAVTALRRGGAVNAVSALLRAAELSPADADRGRRLAEAAYIGADVAGQLRRAPHLLATSRRLDPDPHASLEAAVAAAYVLINGEGDVDTAHRLLVGAIQDRQGHDGRDRALSEALHTLLTVCWFGGRPELWTPFHAALEALTPRPQVLTLCAATFANPVRTAVLALDELDTVIADLHEETDPARIVRVGMAAFFVDRMAGCRAAHWRVVEDGRRGGAVSAAILALVHLCLDDFFTGRWNEARRLAEEGLSLCDRHGYRLLQWPMWFGQAAIAAARGEDEVTRSLADSMIEWAAPRGVRPVQWYSCHVRALAALGRSDFEYAFQQLSTISPAGVLASHVPIALWGILDLAEAAVRSGHLEEAHAHVEALRAAGVAGLSPRLAVLVHAAAALAADENHCADWFERALAVSGGDRWPFDYARVQLLYGERLRRAGAISAARALFTSAAETFTRLRAEPWIQRSEREQRATGQTRNRSGTASPELSRPLTAHELRIAGLAASGLTNKQIAEKLGVSHRTISDHLYRIFPVLGVTSRAALRDALTRIQAQERPG